MANKKLDNKIIEYHLNRHQPDMPQLAIHDLNEYITKHKGHTTKPHIHSYFQVIWFKKGNGKHLVFCLKNRFEIKERTRGASKYIYSKDEVNTMHPAPRSIIPTIIFKPKLHRERCANVSSCAIPIAIGTRLRTRSYLPFQYNQLSITNYEKSTTQAVL